MFKIEKDDRGRAVWTPVSNDFLMKNYGKVPYKEIWNAFPGISKSAITRQASRLGVIPTNEERYAFLSHVDNHDFFSDINKLSAYVAGWIVGDGNLTTRNDKITNRIYISCSDKDEDYFRNMVSIIAPRVNVLKRWRTDDRFVNGGTTTVEAAFTSAKMVEDLMTIYNMKPRKSGKENPPNLYDLELQKAFISGLIDSDGYFTIKDSRRSTLGIVGSYDMLEWVRNILPRADTRSVRPHDTIFALEYGGSSGRTAFEFLYDPTLPLLNRKWGKARDFFKGVL